MSPALADAQRLLAETRAELERQLREDGDLAGLAELEELMKRASLPENATHAERMASIARLVRETRAELAAMAAEEGWPFP